MKRIAKIRKNSLLALALAASLLFTGCGSGASESRKTQSSSDDGSQKKTYTIEVLSDSDDETSTLVARGIRAAADEKLRTDESNLRIQFETGKTSDRDLKEIVDADPDLIITNGERSLTAAAKATEDIPIVASNVMNYQQIVGIEAAGSGTWNRLTGRNITGVSSAPNVTATLSLIVEATAQLDSVGILYTSYDSDAVFQNTRLEDYLDEAGIKWTEYEVPLPGQNPPASAAGTASGTESFSASDTASESSGSEEAGNQTPSANTADGSAQTSAGESAGTGSVSSDSQADSAGAVPANVQTPDQIIAQAVSESSVLFVSRNSLLSGLAETIASAAENAGKGLIAEDRVFGQYALATLYSDPYQEGRTAGNMAASILADGKNIRKMKVRGISYANEHKLYNTEYAEKMNITFPKSFTEFNAYFQSQSESGNTDEDTEED